MTDFEVTGSSEVIPFVYVGSAVMIFPSDDQSSGLPHRSQSGRCSPPLTGASQIVMPSEYATLVPSREIAAEFSCTALCVRATSLPWRRSFIQTSKLPVRLETYTNLEPS